MRHYSEEWLNCVACGIRVDEREAKRAWDGFNYIFPLCVEHYRALHQEGE